MFETHGKRAGKRQHERQTADSDTENVASAEAPDTENTAIENTAADTPTDAVTDTADKTNEADQTDTADPSSQSGQSDSASQSSATMTRVDRRKKRKKDNLGLNLIIGFLVVVLIGGLGLIAYPSVADWWNRMHQSYAVAGYVAKTKDMSKAEKKKLLGAAHAYNLKLAANSDRWHMNATQKEQYKNTLDITGTGIMGYVTIPKIDARLPIYHGTDEAVLQIASGHMEGSSFPIGGESTHAVLTGHTGLPSAMLFTGIDTLEKGDTFTVTVYDDVLTYEVEETHVVLPNNVKNLEIQEGRDLVSLVTCTPYGVNSHRLIVTGTRIPTPEEAKHATYENKALKQDMLITVIITVATIAVLVTVFTVQRRRLCGAGKPSHHARGRH